MARICEAESERPFKRRQEEGMQRNTNTHTPDICRFVRREDKPFGAVWDVFPQERGNNAKMPVEE